ncbi:MAG: MerR family transcriptional regulator [Actinomyces sp.]|nr:MerR family transcriptional regulator [Actinomyces sp.]
MAEDARGPVPLSVLSQRSGMPVATIKYYIREGLIQPGQDLDTDGARTLEQLRLIRGLVHIVGLSIRQVRQILKLIHRPDLNLADMMTDATVVLPLAGIRTGREKETTDLTAARTALAESGFSDLPDAPYVDQLLEAMTLADECDVGMDAEHLAAYVKAARECAKADFLDLPLDTPSQAAQTAVLGTAIYAPILIGLRRLAHRELVQKLSPTPH